MSLIDDGKQWLAKVALKKMAIKGVAFFVAWLASGSVAAALNAHGVQYDPVKLQAALTGTALTGLKALEDWANLKYGLNI